MGIIKTAMMSGAAMYGVKQIAKTAEARGSNSNNNVSNGQARGVVDPEYLEWLEWKRRSAHSAPPDDQMQARSAQVDNQERYVREGTPQRQQLYLTQDSSPPGYDYPFDNRREASRARYQPVEFVPRQQTGFVEEQVGQSSRGGERADIGALIGQGMSMLQSQSGNGGKGGFTSKFLNK